MATVSPIKPGPDCFRCGTYEHFVEQLQQLLSNLLTELASEVADRRNPSYLNVKSEPLESRDSLINEFVPGPGLENPDMQEDPICHPLNIMEKADDNKHCNFDLQKSHTSVRNETLGNSVDDGSCLRDSQQTGGTAVSLGYDGACTSATTMMNYCDNDTTKQIADDPTSSVHDCASGGLVDRANGMHVPNVSSRDHVFNDVGDANSNSHRDCDNSVSVSQEVFRQNSMGQYLLSTTDDIIDQDLNNCDWTEKCHDIGTLGQYGSNNLDSAEVRNNDDRIVRISQIQSDEENSHSVIRHFAHSSSYSTNLDPSSIRSNLVGSNFSNTNRVERRNSAVVRHGTSSTSNDAATNFTSKIQNNHDYDDSQNYLAGMLNLPSVASSSVDSTNISEDRPVDFATVSSVSIIDRLFGVEGDLEMDSGGYSLGRGDKAATSGNDLASSSVIGSGSGLSGFDHSLRNKICKSGNSLCVSTKPPRFSNFLKKRFDSGQVQTSRGRKKTPFERKFHVDYARYITVVDGRAVCLACRYSTELSLRQNMYRHIRAKHLKMESTECRLCPSVFSNRLLYEEHVAFAHGNKCTTTSSVDMSESKDEFPKNCNLCNILLKNLDQAIRHYDIIHKSKYLANQFTSTNLISNSGGDTYLYQEVLNTCPGGGNDPGGLSSMQLGGTTLSASIFAMNQATPPDSTTKGPCRPNGTLISCKVEDQ